MYDLIHRAGEVKGEEWRYRFALHFFMFYDAGEAATCANSPMPFWEYVESRYALFKRGTERRHFRGQKGLDAVARLRTKGSPEQVWKAMWKNNYGSLIQNLKDNFAGCEIGPYFAWKAMDILDRGLGMGIPLGALEAVKFMPDEPRKCAEAMWPFNGVVNTVNMVRDGIADLPAPGAPNRNCGYPEAETVLCMLKGYFLTKTHTIGDDVDEKHDQLRAHPDLVALLPPKQPWSQYVRADCVDPKIVSGRGIAVRSQPS